MATIVVNFVLLKLINVIIGMLPNTNYDSLESYFDVGSHVLNIFAWVNQFVPTGVILMLLGFSASLFFIKMFWKIVDKFINIIK